MKIPDAVKEKMDTENISKLLAIDNPTMHGFVFHYIKLCNPDKVFVSTDSKEDLEYIKKMAIKNGEEEGLAIRGHTVHFDGYYDQARDKENTRFFVSKGIDLGPSLNTIDREKGSKEIRKIMRNIMKGHELYVRFFCLGPTNSAFSIPCIQLTDSAYVAHSEDLLYRNGYEEFKRQGKSARFFKFVHSSGELDERKVSKNIARRRIYIDCEEDIVYSVNTQYGGNTIGLKKLAMRLAIHRAEKEGWLTEHMLLMGVHGPQKRTTYFLGAFPSMCGKTSTAMIPHEVIVGDDISYIRNITGEARAVNVESGVFGIIMGVNSRDDPTIWNALHSKNEIIFSNVLVTKDGNVYWIDKDNKLPGRGKNYSGEWFKGKKDREGKEITPSHKNARFTISLESLDNADPKLNSPGGVKVGGIIYGGRDSDTLLPVCEAFDWVHGVITKGASLESETTAATLGKEGVRKFNPMSNLDFLSIPVGRYIDMNLKFGESLQNPPKIFGVNYFLKDRNGNFMNERVDKSIWLKWMELRIHNDVSAIKTPTGYIPKYEDLRRLFREVLDKEYIEDNYTRQFTIRIPELLKKIDRIEKIYKTTVKDTPPVLFKILTQEKERLYEAGEKYGDYIPPQRLKK